MMYRVTWEIDVDAVSPREAAKLARAIVNDPDSTATFWDVTDDCGVFIEQIDLRDSD